MDNAQKAIMIGVGLFITIIIIAAVMLITGAGQDLMNQGTQQIGTISENLQASLTSQYDGTSLSGSQVISAVKANYKTNGLIVAVYNSNSTIQYGKMTTTGSITLNSNNKRYEVSATANNSAPAKVGNMSDTSKAANYINPTLTYNADLIYLNGSDAVVGIYFHK